MGALAEEIERLEQGADEDADLGSARTLTEMAAQIDARRRAPPRCAGRHDHARVRDRQLALLQAGLAYGLQKAGQLKQLPDEVSRENVEFVRLHEREIEALRAEWEKAAGGR